MILSHRIRLDATCRQVKYFTQASGTSRMVWNWALAEWNRQYEAGGKPSGLSLQKQFNAVKYDLFPWLKGISKDAHAVPFLNLQKAFNRFFKKLAKRPKFKKKGKCRDSFAATNHRVRVVGKKVRLPIIGWVRMTEAVRFEGKIMSCCVSRTADHWYVSFAVEVGEGKKQRVSDGRVGIDIGVKSLAVTSDGQEFKSPKPLKFCLKNLARMQRRFAKKVSGSRRREKLKMRIARLYARITNIRRDCLHKLTTKLCRENQTVVIEDLCVKGMLKNRKLSRAISDVGFGEFRRQLEYKAPMYGADLITVSRWFPSSKTCSNCQSVKDSLSLSERTFKCEGCGLEIDRDLNAAKNILAAGLAVNARGSESSGLGSNAEVKLCRVEARTKTRVNECSLES